MSETRTMYMHTLDNEPASYDDSRGPYIHFVGNGRAKLFPSLRVIRKQQRLAIAEKLKLSPNVELRDYGYVRVEVPR